MLNVYAKIVSNPLSGSVSINISLVTLSNISTCETYIKKLAEGSIFPGLIFVFLSRYIDILYANTKNPKILILLNISDNITLFSFVAIIDSNEKSGYIIIDILDKRPNSMTISFLLMLKYAPIEKNRYAPKNGIFRFGIKDNRAKNATKKYFVCFMI